MKFLKTILILSLLTFISIELNAQSYIVTHIYTHLNSKARPSNGKFKIRDSTITRISYNKDTTIVTDSIIKIENGTYYLKNGYVYIVKESTIKSEQRENVYYVEWTKAAYLNDPKRVSIFFRVVKY